MRYKDPNNVSKQKILLESFKLFATKPFSDITFTDIEKVTGLSRGAILYHFNRIFCLLTLFVHQVTILFLSVYLLICRRKT